MSVTFIGTAFDLNEPYGPGEHLCHQLIKEQIDKAFPNSKNLLISTTWFGPQFNNINSYWEDVINFTEQRITFDNIFFLASVDPPMIGDSEIRQIKLSTNALCVYLLGNFDSPHQFNFFAPIVKEKFRHYTEEELTLTEIKYIFVNYNRKPKVHRIKFVELLKQHKLDQVGIVTLGKDPTNIYKHDVEHEYISIGEKQEDWVSFGNHPAHWGFGIPLDNFSLHRMDIWKYTFLYINGATEFEPINDLFCQQDTFKPIIGLRPFVINGVQRTYHWLRFNGFKTFNHYWDHIDIENGPVHETIIDLIKYLKSLDSSEILAMYQDMLPELHYNKERFFEFAKEQQYKMEHLFE